MKILRILAILGWLGMAVFDAFQPRLDKWIRARLIMMDLTIGFLCAFISA